MPVLRREFQAGPLEDAADERPGQPRETFGFNGKLAFDVNAAIMGHVDPRSATSEASAPVPSPDLRDATINQLARFHDCLQSLAFLVSTACNAPMAWDGKRESTNSIREALEAEAQRLDDLAEHVVREIASRAPRNNSERDDRLSTLAKRELEVSSNIEDPVLAAEIATAWGSPTP